MKKVAIIQARMGSTRLPEKVVMPLGGRPVLDWVIRRLHMTETIDEVWVATPAEGINHDEIKSICKATGALYFVHALVDPEDVLSRVYQCAKGANADVLIEVTADCPLIDWEMTDHLVKLYLDNTVTGYTSNVIPVRLVPDGLDVQVYSMGLLKRLHENPKAVRAHVGWNAIQATERMQMVSGIPEELKWPDLRITLDTIEDHRLLNHIFWHFYKWPIPGPSALDVLRYLRSKPELLKLNENVKAKKPGEG